MRNILRDILGHSFVQNAAKLSASNILMYMLPVVVTPILSRLYAPADFGEWGVFSSVTTIITIVIFLSYENTIVKAEETELKDILFICLSISAVLIALSTAVVCAMHMTGALTGNGIAVWPVLAIYLVAYMVYTLAYNLNNRYAKYSMLATANVLQGVSQACGRILFAIIPLFAVNGLILGTTLAQCITAVCLMLPLLAKLKCIWHQSANRKTIRYTATKYRKFPLYDAPSSLLAFSTLSLPTIILALFYDKSSVGCLSIIFQLLLMPMSLVGSAMGKVYYQELSQNREDSNKIHRLSSSIIKVLTVVSVLPLLFICCGGDKLIVYFLGKDWTDAGEVAISLSLWSVPIIFTQPLLPLFRVCDKQDELLRYDLLYFFGCIGSILVCSILGLKMTTTLLVFSIVCVLTKSALFAGINKKIHLPNSQIRLIAIVLTVALVALAVRIFII